MKLLIFAVVNLIAAALSGAAGGGAMLISGPTLVLLGLTPSAAIVTGKFNGVGVSAGTSLRFMKEKLASRRVVWWFSILGGAAAILGSLLLVRLSAHEQLLQHILAFTILLIGVPMLYLRNTGLEQKEPLPWIRNAGVVLLFAGIVLQAMLGAGLGTLQMVILMECFGMTALVASATRRAMQLTVAIVSLGLLMAVGLVDYRYGIVALVTSSLGGFIGAHIAIKRGNKFVINLFAVTSAILAIQLLWR